MTLEHESLTEGIIGAAIEVHRALGPGFLESIYEAALSVELRARGITFGRQVDVRIFYKSVEVGRHRLDLFVSGAIVARLKAIKNLQDVHFALVKSYLRAVGCAHGLLLFFAKPTLEIKRVRVASSFPGFLAS
jgi:GxxExxY protein